MRAPVEARGSPNSSKTWSWPSPRPSNGWKRDDRHCWVGEAACRPTGRRRAYCKPACARRTRPRRGRAGTHRSPVGAAMANVLFTNVRILDGSGSPPYAGEVLVQGNRISRLARGSASTAAGRRHRRRRRRRHADAGHGRGAHAFLVERPARPECDPAHADRGAHPVVRAHRQALPRHGLDVLHGRGDRQAAPRRRDPQRDRRRA